MKAVFVLLFFLAAQISFAAPPAIRIGYATLYLAYAPVESPVGIREYVMQGETTETWTRLASIRTFPNETKVKAYLNRVGDHVIHSHPSAKAVLMKHEKSGEYVLDFLTFTSDSRIAEWNLMRATYVKGKGLIVYQYAVRFHTNADLASAIGGERSLMLDPFMEATFQEEP